VSWHTLIEPGFLSNGPVRTALLLGLLTAIVSALVGVFTVARSQSFAGHALTDVATTGGAGAFYLGTTALGGYVGGGVIGAAAMELIGVERVRGRDLATGIVLGAATGMSALFLYLDSTQSATTGVTQQVLFGSIFEVDRSVIPPAAALSAAVLVVLLLIGRPLILSTISPDLASARGVPVRLISTLFLLTLAVSVGLSSIVVGTILSTALLIGPAAAALHLARSLRGALVLAALLGTLATWIGILFAYDSAYWDPASQGLPVSFFIVALVCIFYVAARVLSHLRRGGDTRTAPDHHPEPELVH
jgi:zinc/manganese transport system permease protein